MSDENELLEPLATEAGQQAIARAINNLSSLEYAVRAERAATNAAQSSDEALNSANDASDSEEMARKWATKTDGYVDQETIEIPPEQDGDDPTTETINLYSARYYAALAEETYNNMQFDSEPTENSTNLLSSGAIYTALYGKADKSTTYTKTETDTLINTKLAELVSSAPATLDTLQELATALGNDPNFATTITTQLGNKADKSNTYTKTEVDTALSNVQSTLTFDNVPTANSDNPVKSSGIKTALDGKQDNLTFDSTPTANSTNPVTSGGVYTALQNVNIDIDDEITEDSDNPVTSAAIYEALQNFTPSGGDSGGAGNASGVQVVQLYENANGWNSGTLILTDNWDNYDSLYIDCSGGNQTIFLKQQLEFNYQSNSNSIYLSITGYGNSYINFRVTDKNQFTFRDNSGFKIYNIYGIKFSKNLSEQMYSNVLYENASGFQSGNLILNDSYENYDFLEFYYKPSNWGVYFTNYTSINDIKNSESILLYGHQDKVMQLIKDSTTQFHVGDRNTFVLYKIIGYKMAKGGYSGIVSDARMTIKSGTVSLGEIAKYSLYTKHITFDSPMPDTNYEVIVSKGGYETVTNYIWGFEYVDNDTKTINGFDIKCWAEQNLPSGLKINWIAIRPNSYTREGMVEDVLFSNENGVYNTTINLSGNISDYDLIQFITRRSGASNSQNANVNTFLASDLPNLNETTELGNCILLTGYGSDYQKLAYVNDNTLNCYEVNALKLYKVIGIKFGRYVSGVAVDTTVTQNSNAVVTSGAVYDALQNIPSGGGSSITVDSTITWNSQNPVESQALYSAFSNLSDNINQIGTGLSNKQDTLTFDTTPTADSTNPVTSGGVYTALANKGDVTTDTNQNITGVKTFVGQKKVLFKQSGSSDKLGFTFYTNSNVEKAFFEYTPNNKIDNVPTFILGNYARNANELAHIGFEKYSSISGASGAYHLLTPLISDARTPFNLTTSYTNFYFPLGVTDGTTMVTADKSGVMDISPLLASLEARIAALEGNS